MDPKSFQREKNPTKKQVKNEKRSGIRVASDLSTATQVLLIEGRSSKFWQEKDPMSKFISDVSNVRGEWSIFLVASLHTGLGHSSSRSYQGGQGRHHGKRTWADLSPGPQCIGRLTVRADPAPPSSRTMGGPRTASKMTRRSTKTSPTVLQHIEYTSDDFAGHISGIFLHVKTCCKTKLNSEILT